MTVKWGRELKERTGGRRRGCLCLPGEGWSAREGARCTGLRGKASEEGETRE